MSKKPTELLDSATLFIYYFHFEHIFVYLFDLEINRLFCFPFSSKVFMFISFFLFSSYFSVLLLLFFPLDSCGWIELYVEMRRKSLGLHRNDRFSRVSFVIDTRKTMINTEQQVDIEINHKNE